MIEKGKKRVSERKEGRNFSRSGEGEHQVVFFACLGTFHDNLYILAIGYPSPINVERINDSHFLALLYLALQSPFLNLS